MAGRLVPPVRPFAEIEWGERIKMEPVNLLYSLRIDCGLEVDKEREEGPACGGGGQIMVRVYINRTLVGDFALQVVWGIGGWQVG